MRVPARSYAHAPVRRSFRARCWLRTAVTVALWFACACAHPPVVLLSPPPSLAESSFFPTLEAYTQAPILGGNRVAVLANGDEIFPAMLAAVREARISITYSQFVYLDGGVSGEFAEALAERCAAGVDTKILLDGFGSFLMPTEYRTRLLSAGCRIETFRPPNPLQVRHANNRNHRRILVVDGRVAFTGGSGMAGDWMGNGRAANHWRDTDIRVEGPAVTYLQGAFAENWLQVTGEVLAGDAFFPSLTPTGGVALQVIRSSPEDGSYALHTMLLLAISAARRSISLENPYFVPDEQMVDALVAAAARGVEVTVLVPGVIDYNIVLAASRRAFGPLLKAGVRIFEYGPAFLHAKALIVDGQWCTVGSANFDNRSFALNQEVNVAIYDRSVAARLKADFEDDLHYAKPVTFEQWQNRGVWARLMEALTFPFESLF